MQRDACGDASDNAERDLHSDADAALVMAHYFIAHPCVDSESVSWYPTARWVEREVTRERLSAAVLIHCRSLGLRLRNISAG